MLRMEARGRGRGTSAKARLAAIAASVLHRVNRCCFGLPPSAGRARLFRLELAATPVPNRIVPIAAMDFLDDGIVEDPLRSRIDQEPSVDRAPVAGEGDAL